MKVFVDSNIKVQGVFETPIEVELKGSNATLKELLETLSDLCKTIDFIKSDDIGDDIFKVLLNGTEYQFLPQGLKTSLNEGDKIMVEVEVSPLGGG